MRKPDEGLRRSPKRSKTFQEECIYLNHAGIVINFDDDDCIGDSDFEIDKKHDSHNHSEFQDSQNSISKDGT